MKKWLIFIIACIFSFGAFVGCGENNQDSSGGVSSPGIENSSEDNTPENSSSEDSTSEGGTSEDNTSEDSTPEDSEENGTWTEDVSPLLG